MTDISYAALPQALRGSVKMVVDCKAIDAFIELHFRRKWSCVMDLDVERRNPFGSIMEVEVVRDADLPQDWEFPTAHDTVAGWMDSGEPQPVNSDDANAVDTESLLCELANHNMFPVGSLNILCWW